MKNNIFGQTLKLKTYFKSNIYFQIILFIIKNLELYKIAKKEKRVKIKEPDMKIRDKRCPRSFVQSVIRSIPRTIRKV